jgi:poly(3-hydroxyalkanoate) depolymerase
VIVESYRDVSGHQLRVLHALERPGTPLLIFNGIGASADLLRPLLKNISVPVLAFDLPGVGASPATLVPKRMQQIVALARDVMAEFDLPRVSVMGISWGGGAAQQFARQYPLLTERLILAATATGHIMLPPNLGVILRMATPLRYLSAGYFKRIAGDIYGGDFRRSAQRVERHVRLMSPPSVWGYLSQLYALTGWTSLFWLHEVKVPALVLAGDDDPIIPLANARLLVNRLPNAALNVYDCGHLFVLTRLEQVSADINEFLAA